MDVAVRLLGVEDESLVDAFLAPHTPFAFFLRSNLKKGGLRFEGKPYQCEMFGAFDGGELKGVLAHQWYGGLQIFVTDDGLVPMLFEIWRACRADKPRVFDLFLGPAVQTDILMKLCGVGEADLREPPVNDRLFSLEIDRMKAPALLQEPGISVRLARPEDIDRIAMWRFDFEVEANHAPRDEKTKTKAREDMTRRIQDNDLFILEDKGEPVSFAAIGGFLPDWHCVGSVWTPPAKRKRGYGRAVVAGALRIRRLQGVTHAVLFANRGDAIAAYSAIGFERIGDWRFSVLKEPVNVL